jgi:decaprenyl-phosphate phosphoribosyltransferase
MQLETNSAMAGDEAVAAPSRPFPASRWLSAAVREARPRQWLKNLLVFAAPLAGATTGRPGGLAYAAAAFAAFVCASASVYYVNDVMDVERDRRHPVKCSRPIASGDLPVRDAIVIAVTLACLAVGSGFAAGVPLLSAVTGGYLVSSTFYTTRGKHLPYIAFSATLNTTVHLHSAEVSHPPGPRPLPRSGTQGGTVRPPGRRCSRAAGPCR